MEARGTLRISNASLKIIFVLWVILNVLTNPIQGFTRLRKNRIIRPHNGVPITVCNGPYGRMNVGDRVRKNCLEYVCFTHALSISGIGYLAGTISMKGCQMKKLSGCCYQLVDIKNPDKICMDTMCPRRL